MAEEVGMSNTNDKPNADLFIINRTGTNTDDFHEAIVAAIRAGGEFGEDLEDVFTLERTHKNERANAEGRQAWILDWA
jgi:hypothetical protein